jgi:hypothetical protein
MSTKVSQMPNGTKIQKNIKRVSNQKNSVATGVGSKLSIFEAFKHFGGKKFEISKKST